MCVKLQGVGFWVCRVLPVIQPTSASSSSDKKHSDVRFVAQVYHPAHRSKPKDVWYPTWQYKGPLYRKTKEELADGRRKKTHRLHRLSLKSKKSRKSKTSTQMKKAADRSLRGDSQVLGDVHRSLRGDSQVLGDVHRSLRGDSQVLGDVHRSLRGYSHVLGQIVRDVKDVLKKRCVYYYLLL